MDWKAVIWVNDVKAGSHTGGYTSFSIDITDAFVMEEPGFAGKAGGVAGEAAVGADDAVAGDDDGDGVVSDSAADRLCGHPAGGPTHQAGSNLAVRGRITIGYFQQDFPDCLTESGSLQVERRYEVRYAAAEVGVQPAAGFGEDGEQFYSFRA